ncbi:hypothetical protein CEXT_802211 [Caerostris extrusa]|uniref:Uncharacterized protein n=1 Tax=Caerostris extrusa TaxID=172846 RepID=A0AAV4NUH7_CAEEX|nr:hypothetical protein CEXT_802211 [Caerostris extrusa]
MPIRVSMVMSTEAIFGAKRHLGEISISGIPLPLLNAAIPCESFAGPGTFSVHGGTPHLRRTPQKFGINYSKSWNRAELKFLALV